MTPTFFSTGLSRGELQSDPINPDWVLEGAPTARVSRWATSLDGSTESFLWDCTAGRFHWYFAHDETVHIVEGSVRIVAPDGTSTLLQAGDAALFHAGTWSEWHVEGYVLKHAVLRAHLPRPVALALRSWSAVARRTPSSRRRPAATRPVASASRQSELTHA